MHQQLTSRRLTTAALAACFAVLGIAASPAAGRDSTPPRITSAKTKDTNANGKIDAIRVTFSEKVGLLPGKGTLKLLAEGYSVKSVSLAKPAKKLARRKRCYSGRAIHKVSRKLVITVAEQAAPDTAATPAVSYWRTKKSGKKTVDASCNEAYTGLNRNTRDGVGPLLSAAATADGDADGKIDALKATFTEPVSHPGSSGGASDVSVAGYTVGSITKATGADTLKVSFGEAGSPDTANRPTVTYDPAGGGVAVTDVAGNPVVVPATVTSSDGARPAIVAASTADSNGDGKLDSLHLTFSEAVAHANQTLGPFPLSVQGRTVSGVSAASGSSGNLIDLNLAESGYDTGDRPQVSYTGGGGPITDVATPANSPPGAGVTPTDGAAPVLVSGHTADLAPVNGRIDTVQTVWSEPVSHAADADGSYPLSISSPGYSIAPAGIPGPGGETGLDLPLAEGPSADRDKSPSLAYAAAGPDAPVLDAVGNEARTDTVTLSAACNDPSENNSSDDDALGQATTLQPTAEGAPPRIERLCGGDDDWFHIHVPDAQFPVQVLVQPGSALDPKIELTDSGGNTVGVVQDDPTSGSPELLNRVVPSVGEYYLRVFSGDFADGNYCVATTIDGTLPTCDPGGVL